jgi:hypothetical protein
VDSWRVERRGPELRVEITPSALTEHEEDAIIVALEGEVDADGVEIVHLTGSVLDEGPERDEGSRSAGGFRRRSAREALVVGPI